MRIGWCRNAAADGKRMGGLWARAQEELLGGRTPAQLAVERRVHRPPPNGRPPQECATHLSLEVIRDCADFFSVINFVYLRSTDEENSNAPAVDNINKRNGVWLYSPGDKSYKEVTRSSDYFRIYGTCVSPPNFGSVHVFEHSYLLLYTTCSANDCQCFLVQRACSKDWHIHPTVAWEWVLWYPVWFTSISIILIKWLPSIAF